MAELIGYSITAFLAGILLNVMPCVLPVIPFKIQAVMREIGGDIRSRVFAATFLLLGSFFSAIAMGLAAPYVLILLWPGLADRILTDRVRFSGAWTVQVKQLLGFVLLAGAIFFGRVFIAPSVHLILWRAVFIAILIISISWHIASQKIAQLRNQFHIQVDQAVTLINDLLS